MRVAMLGPQWGAEGIPGYCADLAAHLGRRVSMDYVVVPASLLVNPDVTSLADRLNTADVVHIQYDPAVHGGSEPGRRWIALLRGIIKKPVVMTVHMASSANGTPAPADPRRTAARADGGGASAFELCTEILMQSVCVVLNRRDRDLLVDCGMRPEAVCVIPAGAPSPSPGPDSASLRRALHLEGKRILVQGIHSQEYRATLRIMQELEPDIVLVLFGWPEEHVRSASAAYGTARGRAVYHVVDEAASAEAVALADVLVASGAVAGGPRDVLRALSLGIPVVAPDTGPYREIQSKEPCLRLVRPGDADHLAACVKALFRNAIGRTEMSDRGRRYAGRFSWDWVADRTIEVYRSLVAADPGVPASDGQ